MAEHKVITTDVEIEAALERAKRHASEPRAVAVQCIPDLNLLIIGLSNERRLALPTEDVQGLGKATTPAKRIVARANGAKGGRPATVTAMNA